MPRLSYATKTAQTATDIVVPRSKSAFIEVEFCPLKKPGERRHWSRTLRKVLIGSNVHKAVLGEEGPYYDFLRKMYRLPRGAKR